MRALQVASGRWVRGVSMALAWAVGILIVGVAISLFGVQLLGGVQGFESWLNDHRLPLFAWRLALYGATFAGWCWMRKRLLQRESAATTRTRLRRCEVSALAVMVMLEIATWLRSS